MSSRARKLIYGQCFALLVCACAKPVGEFEPGEPCDAGSFIVTDEFEGARRGVCQVYADQDVRIHILPEDAGPINDSPWYAFKLVPNEEFVAEITLRYKGGKHRYWPKISVDGTNWRRLDDSVVDVNFFKSAATFQVALDDRPVWISAQELIMPTDMENWIDDVRSRSAATKTLLGISARGHPIYKLDINQDSREVVFLIGRQHPPEVSGAIGFQEFYESILADTEMAENFRGRYHIVAIPMLNPDGVVAGNWRHNAQGIDLNRDWGPFTQPESKLVEQLLGEYDEQGKKILLFVDFHSTATNLMYTQTDEDITYPPGFTDHWIAAVLPRLDEYDFTQEPRPVSDLATSRNYMFKRYGIPAVTYEVADEEDRASILKAAAVFAEEMMQMLNTFAPHDEL